MSQIILYQSEAGRTKLDVRLDGETVWLADEEEGAGLWAFRVVGLAAADELLGGLRQAGECVHLLAL